MGEKSVSDHFKSLLIDIGNTKIKYAFVSDESDLNAVESCFNASGLRAQIREANQVLVSSVGHKSIADELQRICEYENTPCKILQTEAETLGIQCAYKQFYTLGVDRWLAILAAREITHLPVAVIDLGTANTCDIVVENHHKGGWISPGFSVMRDSLIENTQDVFANTTLPDSLDMGKVTPDCVNFGCLASQIGFVVMAEQYLSSRYEDYVVLVTGGGQHSLDLQDNKKFLFFPNLVLRGLFRLI